MSGYNECYLCLFTFSNINKCFLFHNSDWCIVVSQAPLRIAGDVILRYTLEPTTMLPTSRPDNKLTLSYPFAGGEQQQENVTTSSAPVAPSQKGYLVREVFIRVFILILAIAFVIWGPAGDFIAGRAFTVSPSILNALSVAQQCVAWRT